MDRAGERVRQWSQNPVALRSYTYDTYIWSKPWPDLQGGALSKA